MEPPSSTPATKRAYLLLENPKKSNNLGPILRCAAAYGITTVLAVGYSQCSVEGSHGASKHVQIVAFPTVDQAVESLHQSQAQSNGSSVAQGGGVSIVGILGGMPVAMEDGQYKHNAVLEVVERELEGPNNQTLQVVIPSRKIAKDSAEQKLSHPISARPFDAEATIHCFVISKSKGGGLPSSLARVCDFFVHIPHRCMALDVDTNGKDDRPQQLLDIHASLSIVLHQFSEWAGYDERNFEGHKFELVRMNPSTDIEQRQLRQKERQLQKQHRQEEMALEGVATTESQTVNFFASDDNNHNNDGDY